MSSIFTFPGPLTLSPTALHPGYTGGGIWYLPMGYSAQGAGAAQANGTAVLYPAFVAGAVSIAQLGANVTTLHAAGVFDLAIYNPNPANFQRPGTKVGSVTGMSTAAQTFVAGSLVEGNKTIQQGVYWFYFNTSDTTARWASVAGSQQWMSQMIGSATGTTAVSSGAFSLTVAQAQGSVPADLTGIALTETAGANNLWTLIAFKTV